ncbi:cell filamentation protein Fic [Rhodopseudomonas sp. AAP120]|uniref:Fic family protein n=1 Tax=Rhodopseudomonas TaxID=1073 RepID=UPI000177963F|nr:MULTISPECIES: Fic family protein [Rhodopseudomonas]ACE99653.1 filamentation induced by cAMP protein Fic [Rhodopseudomonas palustris TIE-1]KPF96198.1 cell filamentation protein Fic [Rhodopseudomonas sp. AAP120]
MAATNEKLAKSLSALKALSDNGQRRVFKTSEVGRTDRERLIKNGFLKEIMNGWLMLSRPDARSGDSTSWYTSYWEFCRRYLDERFGANWVLSPENSIPLLAGNMNVPPQIVVQAPHANNKAVTLPHDTSIFAYKTNLPKSAAGEIANLRVYPTIEAICDVAPNFWSTNRTDMIALLGSLRDRSAILKVLLEGGRTVAAGRIAGAYRALGKPAIADEIVETMRRADHQVREEQDPFQGPVQISLGAGRAVAPVVTRIRLMWAQMREAVIAAFPDEASQVEDVDAYIAAVNERYTSDAYHSLSIEGYSVSEDLIERVKSGKWNPETDEDDRKQTDAMAAKGYQLAFAEVVKSVKRVLERTDAATVAEEDHLKWFRSMFEPSVAAGLLKPERLAGYRQHFIFIKNSGHSPTAWESLPDAMETFFECLHAEKDPRVRAVLGHFVFTFIHPLPDGNGRSGRFLMNVMLAEGGYPWTIIPVDRRNEYMQALELASVKGDITPFAAFVAACVRLEPPPPRRLRAGEVQAELAEATVGRRP